VEAIPSATIILGPFGDIVNYGNREILLSWYPDGCADRSSAIEPPSSWLPADRNLAAQLRRTIPAGLAEIVPGVQRLSRHALDEAGVQGGIIFARGKSDVSDPASGLHKRHDIGVQSMGRYHSINTGKYTTAPLFAAEVASRVLSVR
jgi:hypothetical protein